MSGVVDAWMSYALNTKRDPELFEQRFADMSGREAFTARLATAVAEQWRSSAFPVVRVQDQLAASFVLTKLPEDVPDIKMPWRAFMVVVPEWVGAHTNFHITGGADADAIGVLLSSYSGGFGAIPVATRWDAARKKSQVVIGAAVRYDSVTSFCMACEADSDEPGKAMMRLVVGALCELNAQPGGTPEQRPGSASAAKRAARGMPTAWNFQIKRDVHLDLRKEAAAFVRGEAHGAFLQRLVRGHWQRYWTGSRSGERVCVVRHKEPYWQGHPDAPIALRSHVLGARE